MTFNKKVHDPCVYISNIINPLYLQHNQSTHMTDGMSVMSLSASLLQNVSVVMGGLRQIMLN
jgi:hypothetical protein